MSLLLLKINPVRDQHNQTLEGLSMKTDTTPSSEELIAIADITSAHASTEKLYDLFGRDPHQWSYKTLAIILARRLAETTKALEEAQAALSEMRKAPGDEEVSTMAKRLRALVILDEAGSNNPLGREAAALLERQQAALSSSRAVPEWQPIETAPKDGSLVLLAYSTGEGPYDWGLATARYRGLSWLDHYGNQIAFRPTYWQPLSASPSAPQPVKEK